MSKRRKFSAEFKRGAVEQTRQPGVSRSPSRHSSAQYTVSTEPNDFGGACQVTNIDASENVNHSMVRRKRGDRTRPASNSSTQWSTHGH